MDLEQFVQNTICEVIRGINGAIKTLAADGVGAAINPVWDRSSNLSPDNIEKMEFDVAITVASSNKSETGAGVKVGIQVLSASLGGKDNSETENTTASRVRFAVPYIPPATVVVSDHPPHSAVVTRPNHR